MSLIAAKFVLCLPSEEQEERVNTCKILKRGLKETQKIIIGDDTWVYGYEPEAKQQSSQGKSPSPPHPKKARQVCSNVNSTLVVFFRRSRNCAIWICSTRTNCRPPLLRWHLTAFAGKCAAKRTWKVEFGFVHHDSAPARCAVCVNYWVKTKCHSTHTLLARFSTAWLLFPELEIALQGRRFNDVTMIQAKSQDALGECHTMHFTIFFEGWRVCWARCIIYDADYSERGAGIA